MAPLIASDAERGEFGYILQMGGGNVKIYYWKHKWQRNACCSFIAVVGFTDDLAII